MSLNSIKKIQVYNIQIVKETCNYTQSIMVIH